MVGRGACGGPRQAQSQYRISCFARFMLFRFMLRSWVYEWPFYLHTKHRMSSHSRPAASLPPLKWGSARRNRFPLARFKLLCLIEIAQAFKYWADTNWSPYYGFWRLEKGQLFLTFKLGNLHLATEAPFLHMSLFRRLFPTNNLKLHKQIGSDFA